MREKTRRFVREEAKMKQSGNVCTAVIKSNQWLRFCCSAVALATVHGLQSQLVLGALPDSQKSQIQTQTLTSPRSRLSLGAKMSK